MIEKTHLERHAGRPGVVLGNGPSRAEWDMAEAGDDAIVVGCNAAYRDTPLDYVVAVDNLMLREIVEAKEHRWHAGIVPVSTYETSMVNVLQQCRRSADPKLHLPNKCPGVSNSGAMALYVASVFGLDPIWMVGFDGGRENLYLGTPNYMRDNPRNLTWPDSQRAFKRVRDRFPKPRLRIVGGYLEGKVS